MGAKWAKLDKAQQEAIVDEMFSHRLVGLGGSPRAAGQKSADAAAAPGPTSPAPDRPVDGPMCVVVGDILLWTPLTFAALIKRYQDMMDGAVPMAIFMRATGAHAHLDLPVRNLATGQVGKLMVKTLDFTPLALEQLSDEDLGRVMAETDAAAAAAEPAAEGAARNEYLGQLAEEQAEQAPPPADEAEPAAVPGDLDAVAEGDYPEEPLSEADFDALDIEA